MPDDVITTHGQPRGYRECRCAECGVVALCTPGFDFFTRGPAEPRVGDPIYCQRCFADYVDGVIRRLNSN